MIELPRFVPAHNSAVCAARALYDVAGAREASKESWKKRSFQRWRHYAIQIGRHCLQNGAPLSVLDRSALRAALRFPCCLFFFCGSVYIQTVYVGWGYIANVRHVQLVFFFFFLVCFDFSVG